MKYFIQSNFLFFDLFSSFHCQVGEKINSQKILMFFLKCAGCYCCCCCRWCSCRFSPCSWCCCCRCSSFYCFWFVAFLLWLLLYFLLMLKIYFTAAAAVTFQLLLLSLVLCCYRSFSYCCPSFRPLTKKLSLKALLLVLGTSEVTEMPIAASWGNV